MTIYTNDNHTPAEEIELDIEAIEEVIAPGISLNHNETVEIELAVEEVEEVIAPAIQFNHNETLISLN